MNVHINVSKLTTDMINTSVELLNRPIMKLMLLYLNRMTKRAHFTKHIW